VRVYRYGRLQMGEMFPGLVLNVSAQPFGIMNSWNGGYSRVSSPHHSRSITQISLSYLAIVR
jgi:hypothetical protein